MGFLAEITAANRSAVERPDYLDRLPLAGDRPRPSMRQAISRRATSGSLIVEYKRASPGRPDPDLPARTLSDFVRLTDRPNVVAYSCLATRPRFHGGPLDVYDLARVGRRPVLFKDFVVGERQLDAAERAGASAVLLIARLAVAGLLERPLAELAASAHRRGLEVLLEFHREAELSEADGVAADMYGVNVRDLDTLTIDPATAEATLGAAAAAGRRPLIGLSGVERPEDAARFWDRGADGILVGTAVARSSDPGKFLDSLARDPRGSRA